MYVHIGVYDLDGGGVAMARDVAYENIEMVKAVTGQISAEGRHGKMKSELLELNRIPHIRIISTLSNESGELAAYGETVFAVSEEIIDAT